jgi:hypothetical protein
MSRPALAGNVSVDPLSQRRDGADVPDRSVRIALIVSSDGLRL